MVEKNNNKTYKVIVLGGGRVGKSSILQRLMLNSFDPDQLTSRSKSEYNKTIEIPADYNEDIEKLYPNAKGDIPVKLEVWDTAG